MRHINSGSIKLKPAPDWICWSKENYLFVSILIFCLQQQGPDKPPTCRCILFSLRWKIPSHVRNSISGEKFSLTWEIPFHWALHLSNIHWWPAADTFLNPQWSLVSSKMVHYWNQILSPMQQCNNNSSNHNYIIKLCNKKSRLDSKMFTAAGCVKLFYFLLENEQLPIENVLLC